MKKRTKQVWVIQIVGEPVHPLYRNVLGRLNFNQSAFEVFCATALSVLPSKSHIHEASRDTDGDDAYEASKSDTDEEDGREKEGLWWWDLEIVQEDQEASSNLARQAEITQVTCHFNF